MGLFYKTLVDAQELMYKKNFKKAYKILNDHIKQEHGIEHSLTETIRDLQNYQRELVLAMQFARAAAVEKGKTLHNQQEAIKRIELARQGLIHVERQVGDLIRTEKLILRESSTK